MSTSASIEFEIREIEPAATHRLRHELLRPTQRLAEMDWPGDDAATHFGALSAGHLVGIASIHPSETKSWRLRAMAVCPEFRRSGLGMALVHACLDHASSEGAFDVWCNARTPVLDFYARAGFSVEGEEFHVEHAGPHFVMRHRFS